MAPRGRERADGIGLPVSGRRRLLGLLATLPVLARAGTGFAAPNYTNAVGAVAFQDGVSLLVAGPSGGTLGHWANALQPALEQALPPDTSIRRIDVGGADGVTGANQFVARAAPDGMTVMMVPGDAVLAWLVGDPRAQFDVGHWVPVMACVAPVVVVARQAAGAPDRVVRIAAAGPVGPDMPALLGLDLLGIRSEPVFGSVEPDALKSAYSRGGVDAVVLRGHNVLQQFAAFTALGARPLFALGVSDGAGGIMRDPAFPDVPHVTELYAARSGRQPAGALYNAWRASAAASQLEFSVVLPQLTPASMISLWRNAGIQAAASPEVRAMADSVTERSLAGPDATAVSTAAAAHVSALEELRQWLATRFNWHPA
jgi:hypothetical protein